MKFYWIIFLILMSQYNPQVDGEFIEALITYINQLNQTIKMASILFITIPFQLNNKGFIYFPISINMQPCSVNFPTIIFISIASVARSLRNHSVQSLLYSSTTAAIFSSLFYSNLSNLSSRGGVILDLYRGNSRGTSYSAIFSLG